MYDERHTAGVLPRSCATTRMAAFCRRVVSASVWPVPISPSSPAASTLATPGAEVLDGEVLARQLVDVLVHVLRAHVALRAELVEVAEELLAGQVLAAPDDPRQPWVGDAHGVVAAVLAAK